MIAEARRNEILSILKKERSISCAELSKRFSVTEETIRRDLTTLERKGLLTRTHGGAVFGDEVEMDPGFELRIREMHAEKERIGKFAATLIDYREAVFMDPGTTTLMMAKNLKEDKNTIVVTNSKYCIDELISKPGITTVCTGGQLSLNSMSYVGKIAESTLKEYNFNKVFISAKAVSIKNGVMDANEQEAHVNKVAVESAHEVILLVDSSKFSKVAFANVCSIQRIAAIVTDSKIDPEMSEQFEQAGVKLYIV